MFRFLCLLSVHAWGEPRWHADIMCYGRRCPRCGRLKSHPWFESPSARNEVQITEDDFAAMVIGTAIKAGRPVHGRIGEDGRLVIEIDNTTLG